MSCLSNYAIVLQRDERYYPRGLKCPTCGNTHIALGRSIHGNSSLDRWFYACLKCGARTPYVATPEGALTAAYKVWRVKEDGDKSR